MGKGEAKGCLAFFLQLFAGNKKEESKLPYRLKDNFLSPAELSFYHVLVSVLQGKLVVLAKVRLVDIFYVTQKQQNFSYFNRISQRHVDFLLCRPKTMVPVLAIELDDASHKRPDRQKRDAFVDAVFAAVGLPLWHVPARRAYDAQEFATRLEPYLYGSISAESESSTSAKNVDRTSLTDSPTCPNCGAPMILRTVKKGPHRGKQFYGCTNFPNCRGVLPFHPTAKAINRS